MAYEIYWQVPEKVVCATLSGSVTPEDARQVGNAIYDAIEHIDSLVHIIMDLRQASIAANPLKYGSNDYQYAPNTGVVIVIGNSKVFGLLVSIFTRSLSRPLVYRDSIDAALAYISERDIRVQRTLEQHKEPPSDF